MIDTTLGETAAAVSVQLGLLGLAWMTGAESEPRPRLVEDVAAEGVCESCDTSWVAA